MKTATPDKAHKKVAETPLNRQYNQIKAKYPGAMLLFRVGDFYETFGEDAVKASKILGITLTKRNNGGANEELAGFPHHSLDTHLPKLVRAGERVAICDQLEDPATAKGIVRRGVTELVTPGVSFNDNVLDTRRNNYLAAIQFTRTDEFGVAFLDISTGEFLASQGNAAYIDKLLQSFNPSEVLYCKKNRQEFGELFGDKFHTYTLDDWAFTYEFGYNFLKQHFQTTSLKGFGIEGLPDGIIAAGVILHYLNETEHKDLQHITRVTRLEEDRYVWLDRFTIRNLELVNAQQEGGVPLIQILDQTVTPMGARLLRKWLNLPLKDKSLIDERLNLVELLQADADLLDTMVGHLKQIGDLERLISKVAVRRISPRDMLQLKRSLQHILPIKEELITALSHETESPSRSTVSLKKYADQLNPVSFLIDRIEAELREDVPVVSNQGGMIKAGINAELDALTAIAYTGKDYLLQLQEREIQRTGISSLKVAYNKVFGYYLEVTNAHKNRVPDDWIRKQTLVNAERYITPELKEYEDKILNAEEQIFTIEARMYNDLMMAAGEYVGAIQQNARVVSVLDVLSSFARVAVRNRYVRPVLTDTKVLNIKDGRHPVIEQQLPPGEPYVPNDIYLDDETQQIIIITGPNMAGKSALLRQTALIVLMAQAGSFVPASSAEIGIVDKIFTRVGASDNLSRGESTFMVEMTETASILNNLSERSLVLMDEIGRGTSTYDGVSIAWSIAEYLHNHSNCRPKTLFATHYHELNDLANDLPRVKNFNVSVKESGNKVIFMRKLKPGGSEHSFGIHVAQMAGMPGTIVNRANQILAKLESSHERENNRERIQESGPVPGQEREIALRIIEAGDPKSDAIKEKLRAIDVNRLTPIEALLKLNELMKLVE